MPIIFLNAAKQPITTYQLGTKLQLHGLLLSGLCSVLMHINYISSIYGVYSWYIVAI